MSEKPRGSLQARMSEHDPRLYNVNRDVAHNFGQVMQMVAGRVEDRLWPELTTILDQLQITDDDLGQACACFCWFIGSAAENLKADFKELLDRSGFLKCKPGAQVAIMATLGTVLAGYHFAGVREATINGQGPALTLEGLAARGREVAAFMAVPRWKRRLALWRRRFQAALRMLRGGQ